MDASLQNIYADNARINADVDWRRVDIEEIWRDQLFPLIDGSTDLQKSLERSINAFMIDCIPCRGKMKFWKYTEALAASPFFLTTSDGAVSWLDDQIDTAREKGCELAAAISTIEQMLYLEEEGIVTLSKATIKSLRQTIEDLTLEFYPKLSDTALAARPMGSCFWIAPFARDLAAAWRPDLSWRIVEGDEHATVVATDAQLIFDILFLDPASDVAPIADPLWFALGDMRSPSLRRVLDCRADQDRRERQRALDSANNGGGANDPRIF